MAKGMTYMRTKEGTVWETSHPEYHKDCERLTQAAGKIARQEYCRDELRKILAPGDTVYTLVRSVSSSGMSRRISCYVARDKDIRNLDVLIADAIGWALAKDSGIRVAGCGMDMGFHLIYTLGRYLWPEGTGENSRDGGYALKHSWM